MPPARFVWAWLSRAERRLPSGRIISVDTFVTITASPQLEYRDDAWIALLPLGERDIDRVRLTYAGERINAGKILATDLPDAAGCEEIANLLTERIGDWLDQLPSFVLTYPIHWPGEAPPRCQMLAQGRREVLLLGRIEANAAGPGHIAAKCGAAWSGGCG